MTMNFEALLPNLAEHLTADPTQAERERHTEAREVRDRLPLFVRTGSATEIAARVKAPELLRLAERWAWGDPNQLLLGPTRKGKSTAMGFLFRRLLQAGVRSSAEWELARWMRWFSAEDLATCRRAHPLGHGDPRELVEACNARLLFLDDAGWDRDPAEVSSVINARYESGLPTIITTGMTKAKLSEHYGAAVVARMLESGGKRGAVINCFPAEQRP